MLAATRQTDGALRPPPAHPCGKRAIALSLVSLSARPVDLEPDPWRFLTTAREGRGTRCRTGPHRPATADRPLRVELRAAALGDARSDAVGIIASLEPDVEMQPVLGRFLRRSPGRSSSRGASRDGGRRDRGATPATSVQPVSHDQNAASLSQSAGSSGRAAIGPVSAYTARSP
jgi:hypothetical protein